MLDFAELNGKEQAQLDLWLDWDANRKEGTVSISFIEHLHRMRAWLAEMDGDWTEELRWAVENAIHAWEQ